MKVLMRRCGVESYLFRYTLRNLYAGLVLMRRCGVERRQGALFCIACIAVLMRRCGVESYNVKDVLCSLLSRSNAPLWS